MTLGSHDSVLVCLNSCSSANLTICQMWVHAQVTGALYQSGHQVSQLYISFHPHKHSQQNSLEV